MDWVLERELNNTDAITPTESQTEIAERSKNCILEKYKDAKYEVPAYGAVYVAEQLAGSCLNNVQLRNSISKFDYDIYLKYEFPSLTCSIPNATENIVRVVDSSGVIVNSMAMLNHVKKRLELSTGHVLNDSPYTTRPSISITSNEVNYDFMPAILVLDRRDNNRKFLVPLGGRSSDWQFSDPITERRMLDDANQNTNGSLKKVLGFFLSLLVTFEAVDHAYCITQLTRSSAASVVTLIFFLTIYFRLFFGSSFGVQDWGGISERSHFLG